MIRRRVFEQNGEDLAGVAHKCEGDKGCDRWASAKGDTYEQKLAACENCPKNCTPPSDPSIENDPEDHDVADLVDKIECIVTWENAGIRTDWSAYSFDHQKLFVVWRAAEKRVEQIQNGRIQAYLMAKFKQPD